VAAALVRRAAREHGRLPVVLTGGCFQNARLAEGVLRRLQGDFDVRLHGEVPPGDGGSPSARRWWPTRCPGMMGIRVEG